MGQGKRERRDPPQVSIRGSDFDPPRSPLPRVLSGSVLTVRVVQVSDLVRDESDVDFEGVGGSKAGSLPGARGPAGFSGCRGRGAEGRGVASGPLARDAFSDSDGLEGWYGYGSRSGPDLAGAGSTEDDVAVPGCRVDSPCPCAGPEGHLREKAPCRCSEPRGLGESELGREGERGGEASAPKPMVGQRAVGEPVGSADGAGGSLMKNVGEKMPCFPQGSSIPKKGTVPPKGSIPSSGTKKSGKR